MEDLLKRWTTPVVDGRSVADIVATMDRLRALLDDAEQALVEDDPHTAWFVLRDLTGGGTASGGPAQVADAAGGLTALGAS